jgi:hypothetical protein
MAAVTQWKQLVKKNEGKKKTVTLLKWSRSPSKKGLTVRLP